VRRRLSDRHEPRTSTAQSYYAVDVPANSRASRHADRNDVADVTLRLPTAPGWLAAVDIAARQP
jgi:hypothetical protein